MSEGLKRDGERQEGREGEGKGTRGRKMKNERWKGGRERDEGKALCRIEETVERKGKIENINS